MTDVLLHLLAIVVGAIAGTTTVLFIAERCGKNWNEFSYLPPIKYRAMALWACTVLVVLLTLDYVGVSKFLAPLLANVVAQIATGVYVSKYGVLRWNF